jgi:hypothetical protein
MKKLCKRILLALPGGKILFSLLRKYYKYPELRHFKNPAEVFDHYYRHNSWGSQESASGGGSTLAYTENIRSELPRLAESLDLRRILDAPCGDYHWFQHIRWEREITYLGADIVPSLIARNTEQFENSHTKFTVLDITRDALPDVDLWLCRDCLFHLPNADIRRALDNFRRSSIRYLLTSIHPECRMNVDVLAGDFRLLDLRLPPFNLPEPKLEIRDCIPGFPVRSLALWERSMLEASRPG